MNKLLIRCTPAVLGLLSSVAALAQDTTLTIRAIEGLKFDVPRFVVRPGTRVHLTVDNYDDMAHNFVLTMPGARLRVVNTALNLSDQAVKLNYVPRTPDVVAHTAVVEPGKAEKISFVVQQEGVYPYVCTYPGHGYVMYGALYVTRRPGSVPPLEKDPNIAANRSENGDAHAGHNQPAHPYEPTFPTLYRTFMPDCGPAGIAVGLPGNQSYCWDAGACRLRYAWSGGFVDMTDQWDGNGRKPTHVIGDVYFRDKAGFPIRFSNTIVEPQVKFKGYRLVNRYPEFRYIANGIEVRELIKPLEKGRGLVRQFSLGPVAGPVYFVCKPGDGVKYRPSVGKIEGGLMRLPTGTKQFTITMIAE
ncbi:plastocyanin/azurin family copper-binding protein [Larkinella soli]|uniref:plastocyanin/azurin family copper-binding protein n=1 Tax=Larkinella soli TaxID=1770527 RepID=UPI000FFB6641|nr:plastocyanin/azurin family copper-binding protein [Larkinella soli]